MKELQKCVINNAIIKFSKRLNVYKSKNDTDKYKEAKLFLKYNFHTILIIECIIIFIFFQISSSKKHIRDLNGDNQIKLIINTKGMIQVLNDNFNSLPSSVKVNSVTKSLNNRMLNLTSTSNTIIMTWNSAIQNCSYMFSGLSYIEEIDLSSFTSTSIIEMSYMFNNCINLKKINFNGFTT